jgi:hypothetical protein
LPWASVSRPFRQRREGFFCGKTGLLLIGG